MRHVLKGGVSKTSQFKQPGKKNIHLPVYQGDLFFIVTFSDGLMGKDWEWHFIATFFFNENDK